MIAAMNTSLDNEVRDLLEARRGDWRQIAADAGVSYSWVSQFMRNKIPNPGFETLKSLAHALSQQAEKPEAQPSVTGETVREIRRALIAVSRGAEK